MTEKEFVKRNKEKWLELEKLLKKNKKDADQLHDLFIKVSSDLSYARTFFPNRSVRQYLNNLTSQVFNSISKEKRSFQPKDILHFYRHTLPKEVYRHRNAFFLSLSIFVVALFIGALSSSQNEDFVIYILGEDYVSMTEENINNGDPMRVYKDKAKLQMSMAITANNVLVAFNAFVLGLLGTIGTVYILMYNGIMVGAFQYFFYSKGLFWTSFLTIWIHGTIEISAIIIAGAAGIVLGNGLLFPKTYNRTSALQISAQRSLTILLGTVPLFIIAGLLEGFVTRLTDLPTFVKAGIIIGSLVFILLIFWVYPWLHHRSIEEEEDDNILPVREEVFTGAKYVLRTTGEGIAYAFARYRSVLFSYIGKFLLPFLLIVSLLAWIYFQFKTSQSGYAFSDTMDPLTGVSAYVYAAFVVYSIATALSLLFLITHFSQQSQPIDWLVKIKQHFIPLLLVSLGFWAPLFFLTSTWFWVFFFFVSPQFFIFLIEYIFRGERFSISGILEGYRRSWSQYLNFIVPFLLCGLVYLIYRFAMDTGAIDIVVKFFEWHRFFEDPTLNAWWIDSLFRLLVVLLILPLIFFVLAAQYYSEVCKSEAVDLKSYLKDFGNGSEVFELKNSAT